MRYQETGERATEERALETDFQIDRNAFSVVSLDDADDDVQYWLTKSPQERLRALELIRRTLYGYDPAAARLQRVLAVAQRA